MEKNKKYFCRKCRGFTNQKDIHTVKTRGSEDDSYQWLETFSIIQCSGCDTISFLKIYGDSTMITNDEEGGIDYYFDSEIYPYYLSDGEELEHKYHLPTGIKEVYIETIKSLKAECYILSAAGLRTIVEGICNHLKIKKTDLTNRINLLHEKGYLTLNESERLHSVRFMGNDALHEIEGPSKRNIFLLLKIVNHLLENLFINDEQIKNVETIISKYEDFVNHVKFKITSAMEGKPILLKDVLGKSIRRIQPKKYLEFESRLIEEVGKGSYNNFIKIVDAKVPVKFEVISHPFFDIR